MVKPGVLSGLGFQRFTLIDFLESARFFSEESGEWGVGSGDWVSLGFLVVGWRLFLRNLDRRWRGLKVANILDGLVRLFQ
ncbi:hypothetical protein NIES2135_27940 [Leptolyngbya boryana NIES-2135]|jgi:hypothetical protein|uniref:Uncharacterized protein n=1 Tax=Leptolyngbya boryana NIES-2135 TaxID=1973484 RepID=A0A1Z4JHG6_LEPBY|nr:hypothetical protein NIES2135_27940 [Leptolyngbya boryana NIES-2135]